MVLPTKWSTFKGVADSERACKKKKKNSVHESVYFPIRIDNLALRFTDL